MQVSYRVAAACLIAFGLLTTSCKEEDGQRAPDFTLKSLDGKEVSLSDLRGKTVLIDFWATWCPPCRRALPHIQKLHEDYRDRGLVVLGINTESPDKPIAFMKQNGYTFTTLSDPGGKVTQAYGVTGIPTTYIVDRRGMVSSVSVGLTPEADLRRALAKAGLSM